MEQPERQLVVIADDITGAAEIAGIGLQFGLRVSLVMYMGDESITCLEVCDLLIFATNTRSMSGLECIHETSRLCTLLKEKGYTQVFKKTDSVLRGYVLIELTGLMRALGKKRALLLPQNPSKGRIITGGRYYINGLPLDATSFASDPEFPARSSYVAKRCPNSISLGIKDAIDKSGIYIAEAVSPDEVALQTAKLNDDIVPAGGADFFTAYLLSKGYTLKETSAFGGLGNNSTLIVLGSTVKHAIMDAPYIQRQCTPAHNTPSLLFYREAPKRWINKISRAYTEHHSLIIYTNHNIRKGREPALNLRKHVGKVVQTLFSEHHPQELIIEGGATAFSVLGQMGWKVFSIQGEVSPGVIRMAPIDKPDTTVTMKPGSYPWGKLFD